MQRLYFLVPDTTIGKAVVNELLLAHIDWKRIHVVAHRGTPLEGLHEATYWQKSDIVPAMMRAVPIGGATGMLCGLVALALNPYLIVAGGGILLASSLAGAGLGVFLGGMVGLNVGNTRLKEYEAAIERGELMIIADVPLDRVEEIAATIKKVHPEANLERTEPRVPFP